MRKRLRAIILGALCVTLPNLRGAEDAGTPPPVEIVISVAEQKLALLKDGGCLRKYPISTSKFGLGDSNGSYKTPLGSLRVCDKIGGNLSMGAVLKGRNATGEILPVNAPGRDPIVTRIMWLDGLESGNANAKSRGIYIHGTVEESKLGQPVSYGCIRMRSRDVVELFEETPIGAPVQIIADRFPRFRKPAPAKPEILLVSNDAIKTANVGPHGQVVVMTSRKNSSGPATTVVNGATKTIAKLAPESPAKKPAELLAKKTPAAPAPEATPAATPAPSVEEPRIVFTTLRPASPAPAPKAPEPTVVLKLNESILTAGLRPEAKPQKAVAAATPALPPAPRLFVLEVQTPVDFLASTEEMRRVAPLDELSARLLYPPAAQVRLAFRTSAAPPEL